MPGVRIGQGIGQGVAWRAVPGMAPGRHGPDTAAQDRIERLARLLDARWRIPGTGIRFGIDVLLDLLPGLGPLAASGLSAWILLEARRLGVPSGTLLRMLGNLGLDTVISAVPVAGWVGDLFFRANLRNLALLRRHLEADRYRRGGRQ